MARVIQRNQLKDSKTLSGLMQAEHRDFGIGEGPEGQQNALCFAMADIYLSNEGTPEELKNQILSLILQLNSYEGL